MPASAADTSATTSIPYTEGDVFVSGPSGVVKHYNGSGALLTTLNTNVGGLVTGMCFDEFASLWALTWDTGLLTGQITKFDDSGNVVAQYGHSFQGKPESCATDLQGHVYVGEGDRSPSAERIYKYSLDGQILDSWAPPLENAGVAWIDLASDLCTVYYTSEGSTIKRFNVCTGTALGNFASGLSGPCYGLAIRPNGEVLVACTARIYRLHPTGAILQTYLASTYGESAQFSLALDPDNTSFWTGDTTSRSVLHIDIASGAQLVKFNNSGGLFGVAVFSGFDAGDPPAPPAEATYGPCDANSRWFASSERVRAACAAVAADPVTLSTGAVSTSATDARMPSAGEAFEFTRSYTSLDTMAGDLGVGWTDSYADALTIGADSITWRSGSGAQLVFLEQLDGSYEAGAWATVELNVVSGGYEVVTPRQAHHRFDAQGKLTSVKDRNGLGVTLTYDAQGKRSTLTDSAGRQVTFEYNAQSVLSRIALPDGRDVLYGYTNGRLTSATDLRNGTYSYGYDAQGRLQSETDQNNHQVVFNVYGPDGRINEQRDANNKVTNFAWNAATQTATMTDARNHVWTSEFENTLLTRQTDPYGNTTRYSYDVNTGDLLSYRDALGRIESFSYDSRHNRLTRRAPAPLSYQEVWTYNPHNDPLTYRDGRGNQTDYEYDTAGNLTSVTGPDPDAGGPLGRPLTTHTRDPAGTGLLISLTDPRQKTTQYGYDPVTRMLTSVTAPLGGKTTYTFDATGRLKTSVEPRGNVTGGNPADFTVTYDYDDADHLIRLTSPDPDGTGPQTPLLTQWLYDPAGYLQTSTDPKAHTTDYGYDPTNRLTSVTAPDPDGAGPLTRPLTQYTYDEVGNRKTRTIGTRTTTYGYDDANRLISVTSPTGQLWTYGYDANGSRISQVDANGNATPTGGDGTTTYGYDVLGRLASIGYSDATPDVTFAYNANDNRTQVTDGSGTETYAYDALDSLTNVARGTNSFSHTYDIGSNRIQTTYPDSTSVTATYDNDGRLATVASGGLTTSHGYDATGNVQTTTLPGGNGHVETRFYDRAGRLTQVKNAKAASTLSDTVYTLDPVGNPTQAVRTGASSATHTYSYDDLDRLTGVCLQAGTCPGGSDPFIRWTYDQVGNRLSETRPSGATNYTYNLSDQLTQAGSMTFTYDQNGNEKTASSRTFNYDLADRLASTTGAGTTTTYTYDGLGKRLQASTGSQASKKTNFLWDVSGGLPQVALERDGNNALLRRYIYGTRRISMRAGNNDYFFHYDPLGSVVNVTGSTGTAMWTYTYEPYGGIRTETKNNNQAPTTFLKFAGEYLDQTALYHLRARQYDPSIGRFITLDPLPNPVMSPYMSAYAYANDRPTVLVDPSGLRANTCGTIWCFVKSPEGREVIGCALLIGGGPVTVGYTGAVSAVTVTRGLVAGLKVALKYDNYGTIGAGAVTGGFIASEGIPCL
ncbi:MAG: DUF6531 domain-containing protein [Actinomycetota bacterium]|nr:DUF6531 domain-containing protein [Actinomycetota bacterium]